MSKDEKHTNLGRRPINRNLHMSERQHEGNYGNSHDGLKENEIPKLYPDLNEEDLKPFDFDSDSSFESYSKGSPFKDNLESKQDKPTELNNSSNYSAKLLKLITAIFFVFALILGYYNYYTPTSVNDNQNSLNVSAVIMDLKSEFKAQLHLSFRIVEKEINNVVSNPKSPAIIVFLVTSDAKRTALNFAHHVSNLISKPEINISIDGAKLKHMNSDKAKLFIDETLRTHLSKSKFPSSLGVVIVDNLQDMPIESAMIFHSYCDHENAPFKHAVYILIIQSDVKIPKNADSRYIDEIATNCLTNAWNTEHEDQLFSLLSRLLVNVAVILPET